MRSLLVMALAIVGFIFIVIEPHRRASFLLESEDQALTELRARARGPAETQPATVGGYSFRWEFGGSDSNVLIARPTTPGESGARWFATVDGERIFEYDPALFGAGPAGPRTESMVQFLSLPASQQTLSTRPPGWKPLH